MGVNDVVSWVGERGERDDGVAALEEGECLVVVGQICFGKGKAWASQIFQVCFCLIYAEDDVPFCDGIMSDFPAYPADDLRRLVRVVTAQTMERTSSRL